MDFDLSLDGGCEGQVAIFKSKPLGSLLIPTMHPHSIPNKAPKQSDKVFIDSTCFTINIIPLEDEPNSTYSEANAVRSVSGPFTQWKF